jgi:CheY-like chemotaxis protein
MPNPILLVDDDVELTQMLSEYLGSEGFELTIAHDGVQALSLIEQAPGEQRGFDLIVLDLMLPGMNGFEVLSRLRRIGMTPVLMLTARGLMRTASRGLIWARTIICPSLLTRANWWPGCVPSCAGLWFRMSRAPCDPHRPAGDR